MHRNASLNLDMQFGYLLTDRDVEVDLVVQRPGLPLYLVEIKSTERVGEDDASALIQFRDDFPGAECLLLSRDPVAQMIGAVRAMPWRQGIAELTKV